MDILLATVGQQLAPTLLYIIGLGLSSAGTWAAAQIARRTGITIEQQRRDQLHNGVMTAVQAVLMPILSRGKVPTSSELQAILHNVPSTVLKLNPDATKYFGGATDALKKIVDAKAAELIAQWSTPAPSAR